MYIGLKHIRHPTIYMSNEILEQFPHSTINNSRSIVRGMLEKMNKYPSESLQAKIEDMTGWSGDYQNDDLGIEKEKESD